MELAPEHVSIIIIIERCPHINAWYIKYFYVADPTSKINISTYSKNNGLIGYLK